VIQAFTMTRTRRQVALFEYEALFTRERSNGRYQRVGQPSVGGNGDLCAEPTIALWAIASRVQETPRAKSSPTRNGAYSSWLPGKRRFAKVSHDL
jgi:hypothetical protein